MKTRESDMPEEALWSSFFSPEQMLAALGLTASCADVVDFGCGYGTFSIPAARIVRGTVHALDIEIEMVAATLTKASAAGLSNVRGHCQDVVADGTGLPDGSVDYAMLFNILHNENPLALLAEAYRVLSDGSRLGVMHWNFDAATPRGPSMSIRPQPKQCRVWAESIGFCLAMPGPIDLPPYHYGWALLKS